MTRHTAERTRILVVEDEESIAEALQFMLEREGFDVTTAADGLSGLTAFNTVPADLVLLDVMLPGIPGTEVCRQIRATSDVPIIMVSAKDSEIDKVVGLEIGADDYVTKPFSTRELLARINAVLRRRAGHAVAAEPEANQDVIVVGPVELNSERHEVRVRGVETRLPLKEFQLLELLLRNAGRVLTRAQLIDRVWGSDYVGDTKTLDVHIKRLRAKIEADPAHPTLVETVRGLGYKFEDDAS